MATDYEITINMSDDTVNKLRNGGYHLYGFKGVRTPLPSSSGAPLVWFKSEKFSKLTTLDWQEQYGGYTSDSEIIPGGVISASAPYEMNLGDILNITSPSGTGNVVTGGTKNAISLSNKTNSEFPSSGISQKDPTGNMNPICAFPLYGNNMNVYAPIALVLLEFATNVVNTGTVLYQSFSPAALFNLTTENMLSVTYDINKGWITDGNPAITTYSAGTDLAPLLLMQSQSLAKQVLRTQVAPRALQAEEKRNGGSQIARA